MDFSAPFKMTCGDMETKKVKFDALKLQKDLDEIFVLLSRLKDENFEGELSSPKLSQVVVLGIDFHLKLIVPAIFGTQISNLISGFDEFRRKTIDSFSAVSSPDISVVQCNVPQVQASKVETALTDFSPENRQQNEEPSSFFPIMSLNISE